MKLKELKQTKKIVERLLITEPLTRNSDSFLYMRVLQEVAKLKNQDVEMVMRMPVSMFLINQKALGYPPFESVRRARQKLQQEFPDLKACEEVEKERQDNIKVYQSI